MHLGYAWGALLALYLPANAALGAERPEWAFFVPAGAATPPPNAPPRDAASLDILNPPDWYPDEHPTMPGIVAHGSPPPGNAAPPLLPCALCHLPNGAGHVESASLAGLSAGYIIRQFADIKSGARHINVGGADAARFLTALKNSYTDAQVHAAADYFAVLEPRRWIEVREARAVPRSVVDPASLMRLQIPGAGLEPLGNRIIELAQDDSRLQRRDAHSGYIAYVPEGALVRGKAVALGAHGKSIACSVCHGAALTGADEVPPLAGRPPTYLLRQLWNYRSGERRGGALAASMQAVVAHLDNDDMLAVAAYAASLPPSGAPSANRDRLRRIVQEQCAVHWLEQHSPRPCERIHLTAAGHEREGFAVLHDRKGGAHFLLIPTRTVAGMESAALLESGTPNYYAAAWAARDLLAGVVGHELPRGAVGLALNPRHARSQDQLHIHIGCLRSDVAEDLRSAAPQVTQAWSPIAIDGRSYQALRVMGEELGGANPIALLAGGLPAAGSSMGDYTLVMAGIDFQEGPGFILLAAKGPAGELLLDPTCAIAAAP